MKCSIPEISWHNKEPVLSVAIQPCNDEFYRLATAGADHYVVIWQLNLCENGSVKIEVLAELTRHQRAVNCVKWSPNGEYLASADDDANIIIWKLKTDNIPLLEGDTGDKETWIIHKILRGHKEDVYDLCWSPNGAKILSGSIDNTAILWNVIKGSYEQILRDHKGFVQGVSWDPKNQYLATISTDRIVRIFESNGKQIKARIQKGLLPVSENHDLYKKEVKYFHDDTFKSFFRRFDFSQDGTLVVIPSGHIENEDCMKNFNATYIFTVDNWIEPVAVLPSGKQSSTVARFCPILFELREDGPDPLISLPYRLILAVGTDHDVILYDTQQSTPFAYVRNIHYTRLTDLTWSKDGLLLIASSTDGFCALITFETNELGVQYVKEDSEPEDNSLNISGCIDLNSEISEKSTKDIKPKKPNLLETWTIKTPKKSIDGKPIAKTPESIDNNKKQRRIQLIPVETNKIDNSLKNEAKPIAIRKKSKDSCDTSNKNPLLTFLKTPPTTSRKQQNKTKLEKTKSKQGPAAVIVLDEMVASDAWTCQNDDNKLEQHTKIDKKQDNVVIINNETEDFSLHLDESTTTDEKIDCKDNKKVDIIKENPSNNKLETNQINGDGKKNDGIVSNMANNKILTPKRRIPLTTLSSPKQKKK